MPNMCVRNGVRVALGGYPCPTYPEYVHFPRGIARFSTWFAASHIAIVAWSYQSSPERSAMSPVVRAIDVGYGNTKYLSLVTSNDIQCGIFPSLAPQASSGPDLAAGLMQRRNTVVVEVDGVKYEVGKIGRAHV